MTRQYYNLLQKSEEGIEKHSRQNYYWDGNVPMPITVGVDVIKDNFSSPLYYAQTSADGAYPAIEVAWSIGSVVAIGALVGSVVPGAGTAVGAAIGFVVGAVVSIAADVYCISVG